MKKVLCTIAALALASSAALAQETKPAPKAGQKSPGMAADKGALEQTLIANERKLNDAVAKNDKAAFTALTAADGWSADMNGFMKVGDFTPMMDQMKVANWEMSDPKVQWVDANTAIVLYKWTGSGTFRGQPFPSATFASTVWTKKGGKWMAVYHQESEAAKR